MRNVLLKVFATIFISLLLGTISIAYAGDWKEKVVVDKEFKINSDAKLIINHEFGSVSCVNWDKDIISIVATVKVKTGNSEKATEIIENVIVNVKGSKTKVEAMCDLNQKYRNNKNAEVNIIFEIKMPKSVSLELESAFGSAYVESVTGVASISSEYGSLKVVSLENAINTVDVKFGDASIDYIKHGDVEISYSHMSIENAGDLSIESDYSDIEIDNVKTISLELEGGDASIGKVESFDMESSFANIEVTNLRTSIMAETEYGSLTVKNLHKEFKTVNITNEYGSVSVYVDEEAAYYLKANGNYGSIDYPKKNANITYSNISEGSSTVKGIIGNQTDPTSTITVRSDYGSVDISSH
jgi:hypothetical protein